MKAHQNIFFYYRGPTGVKSSGFDLQVENNTTKALVNLLQLGGANVRKAFLELVDPKIATPALAESTQVRIQSNPAVLSGARNRYVVAITPGSAETPSESETVDGSGVPDALLYSLPSFGITIESKVAARLEDDQLRRHAATAGWSDYATRRLTWAGVYGALSLLPLSGTELFLRDQFLEYLRLIAMAPFGGLNSYDFDHFIQSDAQYRPVLREKLLQFGNAVYERLPQSVRRTYSEGVNLGRITDVENPGAWLRLRKRQDSRDPFRHCNLTIEISESAVSFNAVVRDGTVTSKRSPIGVLRRRVSDEGGWLDDYLSKLGAEYSLQLYRRVDRAGNDRILPGAEMWRLEYQQALDVVVPESLSLLQSLMTAIRYPGIHLRRELSRGKVLSLAGDDLIAEAVTALCRLQPFLTFVEEGARDRLAAGGRRTP